MRTGEEKLPTVAEEKDMCKINQDCLYQEDQLNQNDGAEVLVKNLSRIDLSVNSL